MIIVPGPDRAAYGSPRADGRTRDDLRTASIEAARAGASRAAEPRSGTARSSATGVAAPAPSPVVFGEPRGGFAFLAQQLAQGEPELASLETGADVAPAFRVSALRAYGAASDSTIEFLSPTPLYDVRV